METSEAGTEGPDSAKSPASVPNLSVVIPAFNEDHRIGRSLDRILKFLAERHQGAEVIVVDDGSTDRTSEIAAAYQNENLRVLRNATNRGKGYSVRRGYLEAKGQWVLFTDADLSAPIEELEHLWAAGAEGADVVIGSRAVDRRKILVHQSLFRETAGIIFNRIVRLILRLPIVDTQCGFKLFRRKRLMDVFERQTVYGFGFDPEILFLARKQGLEIREVAVAWSHDPATKVRFLQDSLRMFLDVLRIRWNWLMGRYK